MKNIIQTLLFLIFIFGGVVGCGMLTVKAINHCDNYSRGVYRDFRKCINF